MSTIFALSSGAPPAGIAVVRVSGERAATALEALGDSLPEPRRAVTRTLRAPNGDELDRALVLWLPGPATATGEDVAELHLHGGRAVVAAVERALDDIGGLRKADPGEFTQRAFANGRIDLAEAEGLADLLSAETEIQRRSAMAMAGGALSRVADRWREQVLRLSAQVEAALDFSDEDDVGALPAEFGDTVSTFAAELGDWLERPRAETLREGYRVVFAGPPNAGKSSLFNAVMEKEAAITSPTAGTTRDVIEQPVAIEGIPFVFIDTAGLRDQTGDAVEAVGIDRAREQVERADLVLWLGPESEGPDGAWEIDAKADLSEGSVKHSAIAKVSAVTGEGLRHLRELLVATARSAMPGPGEAALNARQHALIGEARTALASISDNEDALIVAEKLRLARLAFDRLLGKTSTEDMLDALFGRFCIGK